MEKRVALVTGGLSGIGKGTVLELSKKGYDVVIFDIPSIFVPVPFTCICVLNLSTSGAAQVLLDGTSFLPSIF